MTPKNPILQCNCTVWFSQQPIWLENIWILEKILFCLSRYVPHALKVFRFGGDFHFLFFWENADWKKYNISIYFSHKWNYLSLSYSYCGGVCGQTSKHVKLWIWRTGIQASRVALAHEQALRGTLVAGWEKEGIWILPPIPLWLPVDSHVRFPPISAKR